MSIIQPPDKGGSRVHQNNTETTKLNQPSTLKLELFHTAEGSVVYKNMSLPLLRVCD